MISDLVRDVDRALTRGGIDGIPRIIQGVLLLLRQVAPSIDPNQTILFDDILGRLASRASSKDLLSIADCLCDIGFYPHMISEQLAANQNIEIAGRVLEQSNSLQEQFLLQTVQSQTQEHLRAIAARAIVSEVISLALIERGEDPVHLRLARNAGAILSSAALASLVLRAKESNDLISALARRSDLPQFQFVRLLSIAPEGMRSELLSLQPQQSVEKGITPSFVIAACDDHTNRDDSDQAIWDVEQLAAAGNLNEQTICQFTVEGKKQHLIAALTRYADLPVPLVQGALADQRGEGIILIARAVGLSWSTTRLLLSASRQSGRLSRDEADFAVAIFERIKPSTATVFLDLQRKKMTLSR
jgi:uncharacterized protein (DUF2336 family)